MSGPPRGAARATARSLHRRLPGRRHPARRRAGFWVRLCVLVLEPLDSALFRLHWQGLEHVPRTGGMILAVNHVSYADPAIFVRFTWDAGRIPRTLAKDSLFRWPIFGSILRGAKQIPVSRGSSDARTSLGAAVESLEAGECVCIYPEGTVTRDPDWWPMRARTGVARLALATGVPVIPVAQWGAQHFYDHYDHHKLSVRPRKDVTYRAGPAVDLSAYQGKPITQQLLREVTDAIMVDVSALLGDIRGETPPAEFWVRPDPTPDPLS